MGVINDDYIKACYACAYGNFSTETYLKQDSPCIYVCVNKRSHNFNQHMAWFDSCDYFRLVKER